MATITVQLGTQQPDLTIPLTMTEDSGQVTSASRRGGPAVGAVPDIRAEILDDAKPNGPQYREIGAALFEWLFPEALNTRWRARAAEQPLLRLEIAPQELADLPWELLYDSATRLYLSFAGGVVRLSPPPLVETTCSAWPLRILLVNGAPVAEEAALGTAEEMETIRRAFLPLGRSVDVEVLHRPTRPELMDWLADFHPHGFHFSGHAVAVPGTTKTGLMMAAANPWLWDAEDIPNDLNTTNWAPTFVVLNACRTSAARGPVGTVLDGFADRGVTAAVATQANVRGDLAAIFAVELYSRLAQGEDIVAATVNARKAIVNHLGGYDHKAWALPVLTVNQAALAATPPKLASRVEWPDSDEYVQCKEFEEARYFAGLNRVRRDVTQWFFPVRRPPDPPNVLIVSGAELSGKSHLVKWCLENYVLGKARIRYVEVREGDAKDFLGLLRQIRDGDASQTTPSGRLLHGELPAEAFRRFNWELNGLLGPDGVKPEWRDEEHPAVPIPDTGLQLSDRRGETVIKDIFDSYLAALREVTKTGPLVLALDQFRSREGVRLISTTDLELVTKFLLRPIMENQAGPLKVVLVLDDGPAAEVRKRLPKDRVTSVEVNHDFTLDELVTHVLEIFRYPQGEDGTTLETFARSSLSLPRRQPLKGLAKLQRFREDAERGELDLPVERMR